MEIEISLSKFLNVIKLLTEDSIHRKNPEFSFNQFLKNLTLLIWYYIVAINIQIDCMTRLYTLAQLSSVHITLLEREQNLYLPLCFLYKNSNIFQLLIYLDFIFNTAYL